MVGPFSWMALISPVCSSSTFAGGFAVRFRIEIGRSPNFSLWDTWKFNARGHFFFRINYIGKVFKLQARCGPEGGYSLLIHDRGTRRGWVVSSTPRPHFTPGKDPVPILQEAGWAPGPVWTGGKSRPHRDSIPDRPAHSQPLYRLSYRAHSTYIYIHCIHIWHIYIYTYITYMHAYITYIHTSFILTYIYTYIHTHTHIHTRIRTYIFRM